MVPQRCVSELQGQYSVYTEDDNNVVITRQIKTVQRIGDILLIEEGLDPDDKVIITGLQSVAAGVVVYPTLVEFESQTNQ